MAIRHEGADLVVNTKLPYYALYKLDLEETYLGLMVVEGGARLELHKLIKVMCCLVRLHWDLVVVSKIIEHRAC